MHRDLKPANIFIDSEGDLKVGDLGLSRQLSSQTFEAFSRVGTPLYMSPEVLQGKGYDWKSDVWSLGCIGWCRLGPRIALNPCSAARKLLVYIPSDFAESDTAATTPREPNDGSRWAGGQIYPAS